MKSILKLLIANIKHKKGNFKSIAALMAIITFSFSCTVSNSDNLDRSLKASFENSEVGDLIVTLSEEDYTDDIVNALESSSDVSSFRADELISANGGGELDGSRLDGVIRLKRTDDRLRVYNDKADGFVHADLDEGQAYIGYSLGKMSSVDMGGELMIKTTGGEEVFTVAGFVEDPVYGSSSISENMIFISPEDFDRIASTKLDGGELPYRFLERVYMLHIAKSGDISEEMLSEELNKECGIIDSSMLYITKAQLERSIKMYSDFGSKLLAVYVVLLTAVVIITIHNSISSSVEMEYVNLGILKSQGFSSWQIRSVYIIQYTIALLIGTVIGIAVSVPLTRFFSKLFVVMTNILTDGSTSVLKCFGMAAAIAAVCVISAVISTAGIASVSPVKAIRGGSGDVYFSSRLNVSVRKKPLAFFIALRQITSKPLAYGGTAVITALLVFFMISIGAMAGGMNFQSLIGNYSDMCASIVTFDNFEGSDAEEVRKALSEQYEGAEVIFSAECDSAYVNDNVYSLTVTDNIGYNAKLYDGREPMYDNEAAITSIMEEQENKHIGDSITVRTGEGTADYIITGIYQTTDNFGKTFIMNLEAGERLGISVQSGIVTMKDFTEAQAEEMADMLNDRFGDKLLSRKYEMSTSLAGLMDTVDVLLNVIIGVVYSVSCLFGLLVVVMLSKRTLLREQKDIGFYKAEGFSVNALRVQFAFRFFIAAVTGSVLGGIMACLFTRPMFSAMLRMLGITNFIGSFDIISIIAPAAVISMSFFVFAYAASYKIKNVSVRELITE